MPNVCPAVFISRLKLAIGKDCTGTKSRLGTFSVIGVFYSTCLGLLCVTLLSACAAERAAVKAKEHTCAELQAIVRADKRVLVSDGLLGSVYVHAAQGYSCDYAQKEFTSVWSTSDEKRCIAGSGCRNVGNSR